MYDWEEIEQPEKLPDAAGIRAHLEWLAAPARGDYDDALIEIAYESALGAGPNRARLFGLDEIDEAVDFAMKVNRQKVNTYVGASLKAPDTERNKRSSGGDFYVATAVPIDIDTDYDAVRQRMAQAVDDGFVVITGLTPSRRSQHWVRLVEPCDDETEFGQAFEALVLHVGADFKVKDAARVMRLGGTVSYPPPKKAAKGYVTELTSVVFNPKADEEDIATIIALPPGERAEAASAPRGPTGQAAAGEIERSWTGLVTDGRESHWRNIVAKLIRQWQETTGSDPEASDIWQDAWETFIASTDNRDGRWTDQNGQRELGKRLANTLRRLKSGHLARFGLFSIETGINEEQAREVARKREETRREQRKPEGGQQRAEAQPEAPRTVYGTVKAVSFKELILDRSPEEPDYIDGLIGPGNFCLIAGPPKAQKSFLLQEMLIACATGSTFLGGMYQATRPLKVFWLQAEMNRKLLRKRAQAFAMIGKDRLDLLGANLMVTERFSMVLNDEGLGKTVASIREVFGEAGPDIIAIDPLANVFDGENEDKATNMMAFLNGRVEALRQRVNPMAAIIMVHHSAKRSAEDMARDPFVTIRGSGALRGFYDVGMIIFKPSEESPARKLFVETRSGESPEPMTIKLDNGRFEVVDETAEGIPPQMAQAMLDLVAERWNEGNPLSPHSRAKTEGRHAGTILAKAFKAPQKAVERLVDDWLQNGILRLEVTNGRMKTKGLKVVGAINCKA